MNMLFKWMLLIGWSMFALGCLNLYMTEGFVPFLWANTWHEKVFVVMAIAGIHLYFWIICSMLHLAIDDIDA